MANDQSQERPDPYPNGCQNCERDEYGRVGLICPDGQVLFERCDTEGEAAKPAAHRAWALHAWGVEQPPLGL